MDVNYSYQEAKDQDIKFTGYHDFIKTEIDKYYILKSKNADPERFIGKEKELKDYNGAKIYVDVSNMDLSDKSMNTS